MALFARNLNIHRALMSILLAARIGPSFFLLLLLLLFFFYGMGFVVKFLDLNNLSICHDHMEKPFAFPVYLSLLLLLWMA